MSIYSENFMALGDDSVFGLDSKFNLDSVAKEFQRIGMVVHPSKSEINDRHSTIPFLGFRWRDGRAYRDLVESINSAINPERLNSIARSVKTKTQADQYALNRLLLVMSLSHDGVKQAKEIGFFSISLRFFSRFSF